MKEKTRFCERCGEKVVFRSNRQKYCDDCKKQIQREYARKWYDRTHDNVPPYQPREYGRRVPGLTFSFTGGKWHWEKGTLSNGPFATLKAARKDADKAI